MSDLQSITGACPRRQTQLWTADELALIATLAPGKPRQERLLELFPGRTIGAIRVQLHQARDKLGLVLRPPTAANLKPAEMHTTMLEPDDPGLGDDWLRRWSGKCERANNAYLAALQRIAA